MTDSSNHDISGSWFGNYYYASLGQASGFEAVFVQSGTAVEGSILDDSSLGEAHLTGSNAGGEVVFCKIYNSKARDPVYYQGAVAEDGKSITGTWRINAQVNGAWKAWRMDGEKLPEKLETDDELSDADKLEKQYQPELVPVRRRRPNP